MIDASMQGSEIHAERMRACGSVGRAKSATQLHHEDRLGHKAASERQFLLFPIDSQGPMLRVPLNRTYSMPSYKYIISLPVDVNYLNGFRIT